MFLTPPPVGTTEAERENLRGRPLVHRKWIISSLILVVVAVLIVLVMPLPGPCPSEVERAYFSQVVDVLTASPIDELGKQVERVVEDPLIMAQLDWRRETAAHIVGVQEQVAHGREIAPPDSATPLHDLFLGALNALEEATEASIYGVDNLDEPIFLRAETAMAEYVGLLERIRLATAIDTFCGSRR